MQTKRQDCKKKSKTKCLSTETWFQKWVWVKPSRGTGKDKDHNKGLRPTGTKKKEQPLSASRLRGA